MGVQALIGLGSNLGDRQGHLESAIEALGRTPGFEVREVSSFHETHPVGGPGGQGAFLNAAARVEVGRSAREVLGRLLEIEAERGRRRSERWEARPLDLDLLLYGRERIEEPELEVPHPRMAVRRFVLAPAEEVAGGMIEPRTGRSVSDLLANLDRRPSVVLLGRELEAEALRAAVGGNSKLEEGQWRVIGGEKNLLEGEEPTFAVRARGVREWNLRERVRWPILEVDADQDGWVDEVRAAMDATRG